MSMGQAISIGIDKENIFYHGIDNPITIAVENTSSRSISIKTTNGTIEGQNGHYIFHSDHIGTAEIIIYNNINNRLTEIERKNFRVKSIPDPVFKIGSGKDSIVLPEIKAQDYVRAENEDFEFDIRYTIDSFTVCIFSADSCKYVEKINTGNKISDEVKKTLKELKPRDLVYFKDILCTGPGGKRKLHSRTVMVY
jgi:hypothetical protein